MDYLEYWPTRALKTREDANQTLFEYEYDGAGRLVLVKTTQGSLVERTRIDYESGSDRVALTRWPTDSAPEVASAFTYDAAGRLAERVDTVDGTAFAVGYTYDTRDNLSEIGYPSGRRVQYGYNAAEELVAVCRAGASTCDASTPLAETYARGFAYEPSGALREYTVGNGVVTTLTYDTARQWVKTTDATRSSWTQSFTYDNVDRLRTASAAAVWCPGLDLRRARQPTDGRRGDRGERHARWLDGVHLRALEPFRLTQIGGGPSLGYDANGSLTSGPGFTYAYTADTQLRTASVYGVTTQYAYDADQWRVKKATAGGATTYSVGGLRSQFCSRSTPPAAQPQRCAITSTPTGA